MNMTMKLEKSEIYNVWMREVGGEGGWGLFCNKMIIWFGVVCVLVYTLNVILTINTADLSGSSIYLSLNLAQPSVYLSIWLIYLSISLSGSSIYQSLFLAQPSVYTSIWLIYLSISLSGSSICLYLYLAHLSIYLSIWLIYLAAYLSI